MEVHRHLDEELDALRASVLRLGGEAEAALIRTMRALTERDTDAAREVLEHDDEIEVLTTLIEQFEQSHSHIDAPTPVMAIKFRMEEKGLTPRQLEPFIGSRARVSEVLSGKRQLSIDMIRSLHEGLGIPYEALISDRSRGGRVEQVSAPEIARLKAIGADVSQHKLPSFISSSLNGDAPLALLRKTRTQRAAAKTDQSALLSAAFWKSSRTAILYFFIGIHPTVIDSSLCLPVRL